MKFSHLHVHTQFSLLDGAADIGKLYKKAVNDNMPALAITDHGNMFGAFKFVSEAAKHMDGDKMKVKPIVGCEFYMVEDRHKRQFTKEDKDVRCHQLLLAKNAEGYSNLIKMCSLGYIEGLYGKYPRIDKELILKYHKGLIATTCCLAAEVPRTILKKGEAEGEKVFKWWLDLFGEDYYIELQRHDIPEQNQVNEVLLRFAAKYNVKIIASNDSHYVDQQDANAHDILLCINTGEKQSTPTMKEFNEDETSRGKRFAFYNDQFFFKTTNQMSQVFHDLPQALDNTNEIVDKIDVLRLKQDIMLPHFQIPPNFLDQMHYLKHMTFEGANKRYVTVTAEIEERLNFELGVIDRMGFAGYFLIVQDFINAGRDIGVFIGPGRGSAAGSAVAYCIGITNIDPIKYNLLFERFLNPERASMPDIDTDFDDEGRQKVIDYVVEKYGKNQVAQIVTYGTMAAKMSIKDVSRVMELPLPEANALAKLVPDKPGTELNRVMNAPMEGAGSLKEKEGFQQEDIENIKKLREIAKGNDLQARVLKEALILEGSVRNTGIHAAGIIIAPKDLSDILPVATSKDTTLLITQFDGKVIEDAGVIKMDFLGLKTLTILRDALIMIKENHGVEIDLDTLPLDDQKTFELYQKGETNGTFQFESVGMQKYLKDLKPDKFEDLIAMNALYRPGPIEYIPNFIRRKHGEEPISYDLAAMKEYLEDTYGITVYQEQVMLLSQKLANFSKGDADKLRKAMGKKDRKTLDYMKPKFLEGCEANGHDHKTSEKVWTDWEAFASYAFNKSHSTCYAYVAYETAYLKAHYPGEYMASVLTHNLSNLEKVTFFMDECKRSGIPVLGPDVNESGFQFTVNKKGQIRFGLGAIKGVGEAAVDAIIRERKENGAFPSLIDLVKRIDLRSANRKTLENLAVAGALDSFDGFHRAMVFAGGEDGSSYLEKMIKFGNALQESLNAPPDLFGDVASVEVKEPDVPIIEEWPNLQKLNREKELVGVFISGHPLDDYRLEINAFCTPEFHLGMAKNGRELVGRELKFVGIVDNVRHAISQNGKPWGDFTVFDYQDAFQIRLFGDDYVRLKQYMETGWMLHITGKFVIKKYNQDAPERIDFTVIKVELLNTLREKVAKSINIKLDARKLDFEMVNHLHDIFSKHKGKCKVNISIYDNKEQLQTSLSSKSMRVSLENEFLSELDKLHFLEYQLV